MVYEGLNGVDHWKAARRTRVRPGFDSRQLHLGHRTRAPLLPGIDRAVVYHILGT